MATTCPSACRRFTIVDLVGGQHLGEHVPGVDADLRSRPSRPTVSLSPVSSTGRSPSPRSWRMASAEVSLTASATTRIPRGPTVPADRDRGAAGCLGLVERLLQVRGEMLRTGRRAGPADRRARRARRTVPCTPRPTRFAKSSTPSSVPTRSRAPSAIACATGAPRPARARPPAAGPRRRPRPDAATTSVRVIRPVVTVPVLSSTIVSTRRVCSSTSGPLIRMPSWAPRPVPTMSAVGVASPSAHGQAMISTATAAVNAADQPLAGAEPEAEGGDRRARSRPGRRPRRSGRPAAAPRPCRSARPRPAGPSARAGCPRRPGSRARPGDRRR